MSTVTTRLGLVKPAGLEQFSRATYNNNLDLIDSQVVLESAWTDITLTAAWVVYAGGGGYHSGLRVRKIGTSSQLQGMVRSGAAGSQICVIPVGFRPLTTFITVCEINAAGTLATIILDASTGTVSYRSGAGAPTYLNINVFYPSAP